MSTLISKTKVTKLLQNMLELATNKRQELRVKLLYPSNKKLQWLKENSTGEQRIDVDEFSRSGREMHSINIALKKVKLGVEEGFKYPTLKSSIKSLIEIEIGAERMKEIEKEARAMYYSQYPKTKEDWDKFLGVKFNYDGE